MINVVDKHEDREYSALCTSRGVVLCDKVEGAFLVLRSASDLKNLKELLDEIEYVECSAPTLTPLRNKIPTHADQDKSVIDQIFQLEKSLNEKTLECENLTAWVGELKTKESRLSYILHLSRCEVETLQEKLGILERCSDQINEIKEIIGPYRASDDEHEYD